MLRKRDSFDREFKWVNRIIWGVFLCGFIGILLYYVSIGYMLFRITGEIQSNGAKSVIEKIWCGEKGCK